MRIVAALVTAAGLAAPPLFAGQAPAPSPSPSAAPAKPVAPSPASPEPAAQPSPTPTPLTNDIVRAQQAGYRFLWPPGLKDTIDEGIKLLEGKQEVKFWETIPFPEDRDRALRAGGVPLADAARAWVARGAPPIVLRAFKRALEHTPLVNAEGTEATFTRPLDESALMPAKMVFVKRDGRWYLRD